MCTPSNDIWLWYLVAEQHPTWETGHNPKEDGENHGRSHPEWQKEYKLDSKTEWCDRHYQEHVRESKHRWAEPRGEETWQHDGQSESQNGYPVDIKDLEADQERDGAITLIWYVGPTWRHIAKDRKLWRAYREGFLLREKHPDWWWWWWWWWWLQGPPKVKANYVSHPHNTFSVAIMWLAMLQCAVVEIENHMTGKWRTFRPYQLTSTCSQTPFLCKRQCHCELQADA